ncbi:hypothetical protein GEV33_004783 [Tenebrio molitor]|uniref:Uncharacterized protein n=1 Tax=Tenebrio molitor TaxID=7067 RepID=A0A8J6HPL0_TENMO|nr:hypothetical protein GEV33_004783 [Tenebrio molitor]
MDKTRKNGNVQQPLTNGRRTFRYSLTVRYGTVIELDRTTPNERCEGSLDHETVNFLRLLGGSRDLAAPNGSQNGIGNPLTSMIADSDHHAKFALKRLAAQPPARRSPTESSTNSSSADDTFFAISPRLVVARHEMAGPYFPLRQGALIPVLVLFWSHFGRVLVPLKTLVRLILLRLPFTVTRRNLVPLNSIGRQRSSLSSGKGCYVGFSVWPFPLCPGPFLPIMKEPQPSRFSPLSRPVPSHWRISGVQVRPEISNTSHALLQPPPGTIRQVTDTVPEGFRRHQACLLRHLFVCYPPSRALTADPRTAYAPRSYPGRVASHHSRKRDWRSRHTATDPNGVKSRDVTTAEYSLRESISAQGREGRGFDSDPGRNLNNLKKKGHILSRDSEVTLSHWSRSIELVIMPLIDL